MEPAMRQSFAISGSLKPYANRPVSTSCGSLCSVCRLLPLEPLMASSAASGLTPATCSASRPSAPSSRCAAFIALFTAFTAWPAPVGPQRTILRAKDFSTGSAAPTAASSSAPRRQASEPAAAPFSPPLTGASRSRTPWRCRSSAASCRVAAGSPEVQERMMEPGAMWAATCSATRASSLDVGKQRTRMPTVPRSESSEVHTLPCSAACFSAFAAVRFQTRQRRPGSFAM
mmetsp:Transcript_9035/g.18696  ORF Transcript_9035/g.18696 Transcript_9035/m.18696 type:complete len:230 (+) Transcript_9035:287-976(+)